LIKRQILPPLSYVAPEITSDTDRFIVLMNLSQANNTGILEQLSVLFEYTHEIFADLVEEATQTNERINNLSSRVVQLVDSIVEVESAPSHQSLRNPAVAYSNKSDEVACQFLPEHRVPSIIRQYEVCQPPPNLGVLDHIAGESCLKKYTNPMFFLETWIEEQEAIFLEAKKKRAQRRKGKQRTQNNAQKKVVKQVELSRSKYNAMGQEFSDAPTTSSGRPVSMHFAASEVKTAPPTSTPAPSGAAVPLRPKKDSKKSSADPKRASRRETSTGSGSGSKTKDKPTREKKEPKDKEKRRKRVDTKNFPPPSGVAPAPPGQEDEPQDEPQPSPKGASQPLPSPKAVTPSVPPPTVTPSVPPPAPVAQPVATSQPKVPPAPSSTPPVPPGGMPPPPAPPPPGPPPPPAPGIAPPSGASLAGALALGGSSLQHREPEEKKPVETRSALLASIQRGTQLRKVETQASKKTAEQTGAFNVAKILARRAAMEFSDEEGEFDDEDWED